MQLASLAHKILETSMKKNCHVSYSSTQFRCKLVSRGTRIELPNTTDNPYINLKYPKHTTLTPAHTKKGLRVYHKSRLGAPPPEPITDGGWRATERRFVARERRRRCPLPARAPTIQSISIWWKGFKLRQVCAWQNKRLHQPHLHARRCLWARAYTYTLTHSTHSLTLSHPHTCTQ